MSNKFFLITLREFKKLRASHFNVMLFCYCKQNVDTCMLTLSWNSVMSHSSVSRFAPCFSAAMYRRRFSCRIPGVKNMSRSFCHDCLSYTNQKDVFGSWWLVQAPLKIMGSLFMQQQAAPVCASQVTVLSIIFSKNYILNFKSSRSTFNNTFHCYEGISRLLRLFSSGWKVLLLLC